MTTSSDNAAVPAIAVAVTSQAEHGATGSQAAPKPGTPGGPEQVIPGQSEPDARSDPAGVLSHLSELIASGGTYRSIATAAGIGPMTVHDLATGRTRPHRHTVKAILAVRPPGLGLARVDAGGTRLRLRALHVMGHGSARIARAASASERTIRALVTGEARTVSAALRDEITAVYEAWWDKRAPERNPGERAAATAARRRAIRGNWCAAAALDDDLLDVPGYKPTYGWKPALGTGVAPDITPRPRRPRRFQRGVRVSGRDREAARSAPAPRVPSPDPGQRQRRRPA